MITISLCMIVKNEEAVLERCLKTVQGIADEIIIVDTGSTDGTKEIAKADTVTAKLPKSPQTGDNSNLMLWFALLFISSGACTALTVKRKYRHGGNAK